MNSAMPSRDSQSNRPIPDAIADQASLWLARRDRGLNPEEQDRYMQWLTADARHAEAMARHAAARERMMNLYEWQPSHTTEPNPDLFAPRRRPQWAWWTAGIAAAALVVVGFSTLARSPEPVVAKSHLLVNERLALPDGSRIELKDGSHVVVQYSDTERRVKLTGGEAQFSVWKDPGRPFIVEAAGVEVRAVGTVFNVRLESAAVGVLVTEGAVKVNRDLAVSGTLPAGVPEVIVAAGEQTAVPLAAPAELPGVPEVTRATPDEIGQSLAWQTPRLQFSETPLTEAVAEFNRLNRDQIVIGDPELGSRTIGGTFRPDNVEGFVRLLDATLGIRAEKGADNQTVLRRKR